MKSLKTSALYICAILGAGFATGKELMVYFVKYGLWGFMGIAISSAVFGFVAYKVLSGKYDNINIMNKALFPQHTSKIISLITFLFLIVLYSAMLSASSELFKNIFNMPNIYGSLFMSIISLFAIHGNSKIKEISFILFPIILLSCVITCVYILANSNIKFPHINLNYKFLTSAFIYSAYNIITAIAVLTSADTKKASENISVALISSFAIFILGTALSLPLFINYNLIEKVPLPLLYLLPEQSIVFYIYIFMLTSAIFTTAVTSGFSASKQYGISPFVITASAFILSFIGFNNIVGKVYFIFGIIGLILIFFIAKSKPH